MNIKKAGSKTNEWTPAIHIKVICGYTDNFPTLALSRSGPKSQETSTRFNLSLAH